MEDAACVQNVAKGCSSFLNYEMLQFDVDRFGRKDPSNLVTSSVSCKNVAGVVIPCVASSFSNGECSNALVSSKLSVSFSSVGVTVPGHTQDTLI